MAKFTSGQEKPSGSGRRKGTPNKKTQTIAETFEALDLNIPKRIASLLPELAPEKQVDVMLNLMGYLYPKKKAIEYTVPETEEDKCLTVQFVSANGEPMEIY